MYFFLCLHLDINYSFYYHVLEVVYCRKLIAILLMSMFLQPYFFFVKCSKPSVGKFVMIYLLVYIIMCIYLLNQNVTQGQFIKRSLTGFLLLHRLSYQD